MPEKSMQPNQPEPDMGVLGHSTRQKRWDAVLGGAEAMTRYPLMPRQDYRVAEIEFETITIDAQGKEQQRLQQQGISYQECLGRQFCLEMIKIPGGTSLIGAAESGKAGFHPYQQHKATVSSFLISRYPITQLQWLTIAVLPPIHRKLPLVPAFFKGNHHPVEQISCYEATEFCARLSHLTGRPYRLPSEVEWEYACRAGADAPFHFGQTITSALANYNATFVYHSSNPRGEFRKTTTPVGSFPYANDFGLGDMHGNVWEWCNDKCPAADVFLSIVLRGGGWASSPEECHASFRCTMDASARSNDAGFRVVCDWQV
jgi:formylglycine-generating enzyme required for sulfatase activity